MKKNDIFKVTVTDYDHAARGIARVDGMVVFINGGAVGDECEIRNNWKRWRRSCAASISHNTTKQPIRTI